MIESLDTFLTNDEAASEGLYTSSTCGGFVTRVSRSGFLLSLICFWLVGLSGAHATCSLLKPQVNVSSSVVVPQDQLMQRTIVYIQSLGCKTPQKRSLSCDTLTCLNAPSSLGFNGTLYTYRLAQVGTDFVLDLYRSQNGQPLQRMSRWHATSMSQLLGAITAQTSPGAKTPPSKEASASGSAEHAVSLGMMLSEKGVGVSIQALDVRYRNGFRLVGFNFGFHGDFGPMTTSMATLGDSTAVGKLDPGAYTIMLGLAGLGIHYTLGPVAFQGTIYPIGTITYWRNDEIKLPPRDQVLTQAAKEDLFDYRRYISVGLIPLEFGLAWEFHPLWFASASVSFPLVTMSFAEQTSPHSDDETIVVPVGTLRAGVRF